MPVDIGVLTVVYLWDRMGSKGMNVEKGGENYKYLWISQD